MIFFDWLNWFNVTINDISVIYVTAYRCAGGLKKEVIIFIIWTVIIKFIIFLF